ncbi:MAG TPA: hypothetical protein VGK74_22545 [Symbiobacteriaceae bacterium]|jgi:hypothetical protein
MAIPHQPYESLRERARRVLLDNPPPPARVPGDLASPVAPEQVSPAPRVMMDQVSPPVTPEYPAIEGWQMLQRAEAAASAPAPQQPLTQQPAPQQPVAPAAPFLPAARAAQHQPAPAQPEALNFTAMVQQRLQAIRMMQELMPKQACSSQRVRELSQSLGTTPGDSVYYRSILEKLREAHEEWLDLEEQLWDADHVVRSTQWLVDILSEPTRRSFGGTRHGSGNG